MNPLRAIKRSARRDLHVAMQVPAIAISGGSEFLVGVRTHWANNNVGDLAGTNLSYAEHIEQIPKLIFWRYQLEPTRGMVVSVESGEAYLVDTIEPPDDTTVTALCTRLDNVDTIGLPLPDGAGSFEYDLPTTWYPNSAPQGDTAEFLPLPDLLAEDATYFYMGWASYGGTWVVRRKERATTEYLDATGDNNPAYATLAEAWAVYATLTYE